jgi:hypothetical protein
MAPHAPITYILAPLRRPPPEPSKMAQKAPERIRPPSQPLSVPNAATAPMPLLPPPEAVAPPQAITSPAPPPDPFAPPAKPEDNLKQRALKSAFAADKQVRKEAFTQRDRKIVNDTTPLANAIDSAHVGSGGAIGELVMPDGSRVTKWRMPDGSVACIYKEPNTFAGGRDPFRDTGRTSVRTCL